MSNASSRGESPILDSGCESAWEVSFLVPCFNEEKGIEGTIRSIAQAGTRLNISWEIVVVDDGSADATAERIREIAAQRPHEHIRLISNGSNRGLGYSYFAAARAARGTYCMLVHGKNVMSFDAICEMLAHRHEADMIITYVDDDRRPWARRLLSGLFTKIVCLLSGHSLRYFNGSVVHLTRNVTRVRGIGSGYGYQAELLCRLLDDGASSVQIPLRYASRGAGQSKAFRLKNIISVGCALLRIARRRILW